MSHRIPRLRLSQRQRYLLKNVPHGARILHVGCTGWPETTEQIARDNLFHARLVEIGQVVGADTAEEGLALLREAGFSDIYHWDAMDLGKFPVKNFDCVVASDVIEHLENPGQLLDGVATLLKPGGVLLVSTVNAFSIDRLIKLPFNWESVHAEHVCYYSYTTLKQLVSRYGFVVEDGAYYYEPNWRGYFSSAFHFIGYAVMRLVSFAVPHYAMGIVLVLRRPVI